MKRTTEKSFTFDIKFKVIRYNPLMETKNGIVVSRNDIEKLLDMSWFAWNDIMPEKYHI